MIFRAAVLISSAVMLAACTTPVTPDDTVTGAEPAGYERIVFKGGKATSAERKACAAVGGSVERGGMLGRDQCVQSYPDAGASCKSDTDCAGRCLLSPDSPDEVDQPTDDGICQATDSPFGCYATVDEGIVQWAICVD